MVAPLIKHRYHSTKGDGTDSTFVRPSDWNDDHAIDVSQSSVLGATEAGPAEELPLITTGPTDDGSVWTKAAVEAAIAAAIAALGPSPAVTGDFMASLAAAKGGWLLANGQTIGNVGSTANFISVAAENLFNLLWGLNGATWPVLDAAGAASRGATANADWLALKKLPVPDARGCVLGMIDPAGTVAPLIDKLGLKVGEDKHILSIDELPTHAHATGPFGQTYSGNSNVGGLFGFMVGNNLSGLTGNVGSYAPHNNVQPTIGSNIFIKL